MAEVSDSLVKEIIACEHEGRCDHQCSAAFRLIPNEIAFYKRMNLPVPRLCPNCRHFARLLFRNPMKLRKRICVCAGTESENGAHTNTVSHFHGENHCPNEFETSYAPERPEIIYCEQCYQAEVV